MPGRGSTFSSEEDSIILAHSSCQDTQIALRAAGFDERNCNSLKSRRALLRRKGGIQSDGEADKLLLLHQERVQLERIIGVATERLTTVLAEIRSETDTL